MAHKVGHDASTLPDPLEEGGTVQPGKGGRIQGIAEPGFCRLRIQQKEGHPAVSNHVATFEGLQLSFPAGVFALKDGVGRLQPRPQIRKLEGHVQPDRCLRRTWNDAGNSRTLILGHGQVRLTRGAH